MGDEAFSREQWESALLVARCLGSEPRTAEKAARQEELLALLLPGRARRLQKQRESRGARPRAGAPAPAEPAQLPEASPDAVRVEKPLLSRPLYPNPVCFLTTWARRPAGEAGEADAPLAVNLMTISWLTPTDNEGRFVCSMNQRRFSARLLAANPVFSLSVATQGMEELLLEVGGCSGETGDKVARLGVDLCRPGWQPLAAPLPSGPSCSSSSAAAALDGSRHLEIASLEGRGAAPAAAGWPVEGDVVRLLPTEAAEEAVAGGLAVARGVAHIVAQVREVRPSHGHFLLSCETLAAFVRKDYWSGKTLEPREGLPPLLSFFGSKRFGCLSAFESRD